MTEDTSRTSVMRRLRTVLVRLAAWFGKTQREREFAAEVGVALAPAHRRQPASRHERGRGS